MSSALIIIFAFLALAIFLGVRARRGKDMDLEQWTVGGRGFGTIFVFLLMAGEIYTTFTFLGGSGWAYSEGGPALYILPYGTLAYVISYWLMPVIWQYAKEKRVVSQADFFVHKFDSKNLGVLVSLVAVVAMVPYLALQLTGLGLIVSIASYGAIPSWAAVVIGLASVIAYVMISGVHGSAWTAVVKDVMVLAVAVFLGLYLPFALYGGFGSMFAEIEAAKGSEFLTLGGDYNTTWFISTILLSALGFYMWPHTFGAALTSSSKDVFRRNAVILPLYQIILLFVFFVGFAAVLAVPGLQNGDLSLLRISTENFSPAVVGIIGGAGLLTALVPGSLLLIQSATLLVKNVYAAFATSTTDAQIGRYSKFIGVPFVGLAALYFTFAGGQSIVLLLLLGYSLVTQVFPAMLLSLFPRPFVNKYGAASGIVVGVAIVTYMTVSGADLGTLLPWLPSSIHTIHEGIVGIIFNAIVLVVVSLATKPFAESAEASAESPEKMETA